MMKKYKLQYNNYKTLQFTWTNNHGREGDENKKFSLSLDRSEVPYYSDDETILIRYISEQTNIPLDSENFPQWLVCDTEVFKEVFKELGHEVEEYSNRHGDSYIWLRMNMSDMSKSIDELCEKLKEKTKVHDKI